MEHLLLQPYLGVLEQETKNNVSKNKAIIFFIIQFLSIHHLHSQ